MWTIMRSVVVLLPVLLDVRTPLAAAESTACYEARLPLESGPIKRVLVSLPGPTVTFEQWGFPQDIFEAPFNCEPGKDGIHECSLDCDAGVARLTPIGDGKMFLDANNVGVISRSNSFALGVAETGGLAFNGSFILTRREAPYCDFEREAVRVHADDSLHLTAGMTSPDVERVEKALSDLGYSVMMPDWVFTNETARAVKSFQETVGLPATGTVDGRTLYKLSRFAVLGAGC